VTRSAATLSTCHACCQASPWIRVAAQAGSFRRRRDGGAGEAESAPWRRCGSRTAPADSSPGPRADWCPRAPRRRAAAGCRSARRRARPRTAPASRPASGLTIHGAPRPAAEMDQGWIGHRFSFSVIASAAKQSRPFDLWNCFVAALLAMTSKRVGLDFCLTLRGPRAAQGPGRAWPSRWVYIAGLAARRARPCRCPGNARRCR